jgi:hypothetical protein
MDVSKVDYVELTNQRGENDDGLEHSWRCCWEIVVLLIDCFDIWHISDTDDKDNAQLL